MVAETAANQVDHSETWRECMTSWLSRQAIIDSKRLGRDSDRVAKPPLDAGPRVTFPRVFPGL